MCGPIDPGLQASLQAVREQQLLRSLSAAWNEDQSPWAIPARSEPVPEATAVAEQGEPAEAVGALGAARD